MGHVKDRWTSPGPNGRRVHNDHWGKGRRWQARWFDSVGVQHAKAFRSKDEALDWLRAVESGRPAARVAVGGVTFGSYAAAWLEHQLHQRSSTKEAAEGMFRRMLYPQLGSLPLGRMVRADVQAAVTQWSSRYAASTVEIAYGYVAAVFKHAVADEVVERSPCVRISLPEDHRVPLVPLTKAQVLTIAGRVPVHYRDMVWFVASTGLRISEACGLSVDRIVGDGTGVRIDRQLIGRTGSGMPLFGPPKSKAGIRTLQLGAVGSAALLRHLAEFPPDPVTGMVFLGRQGWVVTRKQAAGVWRSATAGMGLRPRSGWHDLRHYCASLLISAGVSPRGVADWLGHADPAETLRTYTHWWPSDHGRIRAAIDGELGVGEGQGRDTASDLA